MTGTFDTILRSGTVVNQDGEGVRDIGIAGGRVAEIGSLGSASAGVGPTHVVGGAHNLFYGHIGAIDLLAVSVERAAKMIENDRLQAFKDERYKGWGGDLGKKILSGDLSLEALRDLAVDKQINPPHVSGRQEYLEGVVNQAVHG